MSVTSIHARIAAIEARFATPPAVRPGDFAEVFAAALGQSGTSTQTISPPSSGGSYFPAIAAGQPLGGGPWSRGVPSPPTAGAGHAHVQPPAELLAHGNGRIPPAALAPIGVGNHRMWSPAAAAFQQMTAAAAAGGVRVGVTDSYRSYDQQVDLAARKGLYSEGGLAADPGRATTVGA